MKAIILAGDHGTRLGPMTRAISKQLLSVYDKPMIYYPLSVLMLAEMREVLLITSGKHQGLYRDLLGDGSRLGMQIHYAEQSRPGGLAEAFLIGEDYIDSQPVCLILGDNVLFGQGLTEIILQASRLSAGAQIFSCHVREPQRYGVVEVGEKGQPLSLEEKPPSPRSSFAVPGLYFYDDHAVSYARKLQPSARGELEITDLNRMYMHSGQLKVRQLGRGITWLDMGTERGMLEAGSFIQAVQDRQGSAIGCVEEIAYRQGWIFAQQVRDELAGYRGSDYGKYLRQMLEED